jgi:hypothetical protein
MATIKIPCKPWRSSSLLAFILVIGLNLFSRTQVQANLVIIPTFESSITSDPNAATIEATINDVIAVYAASFSDSLTVTIHFQEMTNGLGMSSFSYIPGNAYSTFRAKLAAGANTPAAFTALAHLPTGSVNPVNGSTTIALNLVNGRALGFTGGWTGSPDGTISLNTSIMNLSRASINPSKYDLYAVTAHEIDEVLGLVSGLDGLANGDPAPTGDISVMDLYRYDQNGNRSFNTTQSSQAWFSLDGKDLLVRYNQTAGGDFHDWYSPTGTHRVQDAYATGGTTPDLTVELTALNVIGYHLIIPAVDLTKVGPGKETISWIPANPGFALQETTNLTSPTWVNSASGTNNPITITNTSVQKFYRIYHP